MTEEERKGLYVDETSKLPLPLSINDDGIEMVGNSHRSKGTRDKSSGHAAGLALVEFPMSGNQHDDIRPDNFKSGYGLSKVYDEEIALINDLEKSFKENPINIRSRTRVQRLLEMFERQQEQDLIYDKQGIDDF